MVLLLVGRKYTYINYRPVRVLVSAELNSQFQVNQLSVPEMATVGTLT